MDLVLLTFFRTAGACLDMRGAGVGARRSLVGERGRRRLSRLGFHFFAGVDRRFHAPLTLVVAPLRVLVHEARSSSLGGRLRGVLGGTGRLLQLIGRLLSFHHLRRGKRRLGLSRIRVGPFVRRGMGLFDRLTRGGGVALRYRYYFAPRSCIYLSEKGAVHVVGGLLSGTVGFAPRGNGVDVRSK